MKRVPAALLWVTLPLLLAAPAAGQLEGRIWTHEPLGIRMQIPDDFTPQQVCDCLEFGLIKVKSALEREPERADLQDQF